MGEDFTIWAFFTNMPLFSTIVASPMLLVGMSDFDLLLDFLWWRGSLLDHLGALGSLGRGVCRIYRNRNFRFGKPELPVFAVLPARVGIVPFLSTSIAPSVLVPFVGLRHWLVLLFFYGLALPNVGFASNLSGRGRGHG